MGTRVLGPGKGVGGSPDQDQALPLSPGEARWPPALQPCPSPSRDPLPGPAPAQEKSDRCVWVSVLLVPLLPSPLPSLSCSTCNYPFYQGERPCNSLVEALTRQRGCFQVRKEKGNPARIGNLIHQASLDRPH